MLLQLREMVPAAAAGIGAGAASSSSSSSAAPLPLPLLALGARPVCGITVGNYRRLPGERGEDEVDDTTVDAEVVDAGDGDVDDSWRSLLKNTGALEAMVAGLLAAPAAENAARGPSPGERRKAKRNRVIIVASVFGACLAAVVGAFVVANKEEKRSGKEKGKQ